MLIIYKCKQVKNLGKKIFSGKENPAVNNFNQGTWNVFLESILLKKPQKSQGDL